MKRPISEREHIRELLDVRAMEELTRIPETSMHILVEELLRVLIEHECRFKVTLIHSEHCTTIDQARELILETALPALWSIYSNPDDPDYSSAMANVLAGVANARTLNPWLYEYYAYMLACLAKRRREQHHPDRDFRIVKKKL